MIEKSVLEEVLGVAMQTGGDFAEVFAEDRRNASAVLDDGRVEELTSGRDRGAGIRVVVGDTTGFAHTADLTEAGLLAAAEAAAAAEQMSLPSLGARRLADTTSRPTQATFQKRARLSCSHKPTTRLVQLATRFRRFL